MPSRAARCCPSQDTSSLLRGHLRAHGTPLARPLSGESGLSRDLILQPDAIAAIIRDREGNFHVTTNHHAVGAGATWGMFWGMLFGLLFFVPFLGMAVG